MFGVEIAHYQIFQGYCGICIDGWSTLGHDEGILFFLQQHFYFLLFHQRFSFLVEFLLKEVPVGSNKDGVDLGMLSLQFEEYFKDDESDKTIEGGYFDGSVTSFVFFLVHTVNWPGLAGKSYLALI